MPSTDVKSTFLFFLVLRHNYLYQYRKEGIHYFQIRKQYGNRGWGVVFYCSGL